MKKKTPKKYQKKMALIYEKAWNDVVDGLSDYKKNIIINNFDVISGHHIYHNRADKRVAHDAAKEAARRADRIIDVEFSGKY